MGELDITLTIFSRDSYNSLRNLPLLPWRGMVQEGVERVVDWGVWILRFGKSVTLRTGNCICSWATPAVHELRWLGVRPLDIELIVRVKHPENILLIQAAVVVLVTCSAFAPHSRRAPTPWENTQVLHFSIGIDSLYK